MSMAEIALFVGRNCYFKGGQEIIVAEPREVKNGSKKKGGAFRSPKETLHVIDFVRR